MAGTISCDLCGQENAVLMQTNLANGDSVAVGDACMALFLATMLGQQVSGMSDDAFTANAETLMPLTDALVNRFAPADISDAAAGADGNNTGGPLEAGHSHDDSLADGAMTKQLAAEAERESGDSHE